MKINEKDGKVVMSFGENDMNFLFTDEHKFHDEFVQTQLKMALEPDTVEVKNTISAETLKEFINSSDMRWDERWHILLLFFSHMSDEWVETFNDKFDWDMFGHLLEQTFKPLRDIWGPGYLKWKMIGSTDEGESEA